MSPVFRPMKRRDARQVASIEARAWKTAYRGIIDPGVLRGMQPDSPRWEARLREGRHRIWVCADGSDVLGYSMTGPNGDRDLEPGFAGEVFALYVDPVMQGRGIGRLLLDGSFEGLEADGFLWGVVWVLEANDAARGFYERCGLELDGGWRRTRLGRQRLPVTRYAKPLNDLDPFALAALPVKNTLT